MAANDRQGGPQDEARGERVQDAEIPEDVEGDEFEIDEGEVGEGESTEVAADDTGEEQAPGRQDDRIDRRSRGEERFQRLANENAELRRRLGDVETTVRQPRQEQRREETDEEFNNRIAMLPPDERMEARYQRSERINQQRLAMLQFQNQDQLDKVQYDARAAHDKRYSRYAQPVEDLVARERQQGRFISREVALKYLIGERILGSSGKEIAKRKQKGQEAIRRQTTPAPNNRGDAGGRRERGSDRSSRDRRLEDMEI